MRGARAAPDGLVVLSVAAVGGVAPSSADGGPWPAWRAPAGLPGGSLRTIVAPGRISPIDAPGRRSWPQLAQNVAASGRIVPQLGQGRSGIGQTVGAATAAWFGQRPMP